jgi:hypothetical protein
MAATWKKLAYEDEVMLKTVADANSVIYAVTNDTPAALAMGASTVVARLAAGNVVAATPAEIRTLLNVADGATAVAKITAATLEIGTDDTGFVTAASIHSASQHQIPHVAPGTAGHVLVSDGTDWVAADAATAAAHEMLSVIHSDSTGASVVDGDVIIGNATPKWSKLAISIPGAGLLNMLGIVNGELRPSWKALFDVTVPTTIAPSDAAAAGTAVVAARRDHLHAAPATYPATAHALSGHTAGAANIGMGGFQITDIVLHTVANAAALAALTAVKGKFAFQTDTAAMYICTAIA